MQSQLEWAGGQGMTHGGDRAKGIGKSSSSGNTGGGKGGKGLGTVGNTGGPSGGTGGNLFKAKGQGKGGQAAGKHVKGSAGWRAATDA